MANQFLTIKEVARQALPRLIENLVIPTRSRNAAMKFRSASPQSWKRRNSTQRRALRCRTSTTARP